MATIYDLKPRFQALLRPLVAGIARAGLTANAVTAIALVLSIAAGVAVSFARERPALLLILPVWLFVRMALNAIDGMMARELGMASRPGALLNEIGDVVSDVALYLPLARFTDGATWPAVALALGAALTEFCGVLGPTIGAPRRYDGPMGKSDRAFVVGALALATWFAPGLARFWPWILGAAAALTAVTCWNRLRRALA